MIELLELLNKLGLYHGRSPLTIPAKKQAKALRDALAKGIDPDESEAFLRDWVPHRASPKTLHLSLTKRQITLLRKLADERVTNINYLVIQLAEGSLTPPATPTPFVDAQMQVEEFQREFKQPAPKTYRRLTVSRKNLRKGLIAEEASELLETFDLKGQEFVLCFLKEACDLIYVILGTFVEMGLDYRPFFSNVHESNMSKVGAETVNGKLIKPDSYKKADMASVLKKIIKK